MHTTIETWKSLLYGNPWPLVIGGVSQAIYELDRLTVLSSFFVTILSTVRQTGSEAIESFGGATGRKTEIEVLCGLGGEWVGG